MANTTVIQIKRSLTANSPESLNIGEPGYSYLSNTFFIGSPDSNGVIEIGGYKYQVQQQQIFDLSNSNYLLTNASFKHANSGFIHANAAFDFANTLTAGGAVDTWGRIRTNSAFNHANAAFVRANNSLDANNGGVVTGDVQITGNLTVIGETVYANTETILIADNIITLNAAVRSDQIPT